MRINTLTQMTLFQIRTLLRNKVAFFFSLILPIILVAIFGTMYAPTNSANPTSIGLVDHDGGPVAGAIVTAADATGLCRITRGSEADLRTKLSKGSLAAILILPEGLSRRVGAGETAVPVTVMRDPSSGPSAQAAEVVLSFVSRLGITLVNAAPALQPVRADLPGSDRYDVLDFLMPGQLVYMILSSGLMSVAIELATQRANGTLRHMFSTPLSITTWTFSRVISVLLLSFVQITALFGAAWLMFRVNMPMNLLGTVFVLILCSVATLGIGLAIGALVKSGEAAFPVTMVLFMILAMLGNAMMPLDGAPAIMHTLAKVMPSTFMTHALKATMMQGKGLGEIGTDIAVLLACALVFNGIAIWRMRRQMTAA